MFAHRANGVIAMLTLNALPDHGAPLDPADAAALGEGAADEVERFLRLREEHRPTPRCALPALAGELGVGAVFVKDEGFRLGLGSFKALGGAYAVVRLALEEAARRLGRPVAIEEWRSEAVRAVAAGMTFACATDGNHGRSVAQGAALVGAKAIIFVHAGVSAERIAAIARFGAEVIPVEGNYDDSVLEAARVSAANGWTIVSDTAWPGYERIPLMVMQGYTATVREALRELDEPPTHVFMQAGVGGLAAAVAGHLALKFGDARPTFVVVEPSRSACLFASARAGRPVKIEPGEPTVMAMLECYDPSPIAWRVLSRVADAFMTVEDEDAVAVMNRLAHPARGDPAIVSGESGGAGLAGLIRCAGSAAARAALGLGPRSRALVVNSEGATDPGRYRELVSVAQPTTLARKLLEIVA
jgi:diaminopropionate ammonia-lyase